MKFTHLAGKKRTRSFLAYFLLVPVFLFWGISHAGIPGTQDYSINKIQCRWRNVDRIVIVGDLHGAYENFVKILKQTGLIDEQLQWIGGKSHLVQMGDILDRGDRARDIFELLIELEKSAQDAGGFVHVLIGNHEEMNLTDTAFDSDNYITPKQFVSFLSEKFVKRQERKFIRQEDLSKEGSLPLELDFTHSWKRVIESAKNNLIT